MFMKKLIVAVVSALLYERCSGSTLGFAEVNLKFNMVDHIARINLGMVFREQ